jgi:hypothetical protein
MPQATESVGGHSRTLAQARYPLARPLLDGLPPSNPTLFRYAVGRSVLNSSGDLDPMIGEPTDKPSASGEKPKTYFSACQHDSNRGGHTPPGRYLHVLGRMEVATVKPDVLEDCPHAVRQQPDRCRDTQAEHETCAVDSPKAHSRIVAPRDAGGHSRILAQRVALSPPVVIVRSWRIAVGECLA